MVGHKLGSRKTLALDLWLQDGGCSGFWHEHIGAAAAVAGFAGFDATVGVMCD